jgi:tetratricopeptide (TPR) repeat protein
MVTLNRLPRRQRTKMIAHVTGGKALPKEIAEQIVDRTDGVPLFIEELTKSVVESGIVREAGDHYAVAGPVTSLAIPSSLHASLLARLDRLAPTREVAQIGSALGRSFSHELIGAVAQMPQQKLDEALEQLVTAELIFRRGRPPDAEYTFKHALVQDAAYGTLLRAPRQQIHGRIAATLENDFPEVVAAQPALMAQHCTQAGLDEKAVGYRLKAGQQAVARSAMTEAVGQLEKGLGLLSTQSSGPARQQQELDLLVALGPALIATSGYSSPKVGETFGRATALAEQINRSDYLVSLSYVRWAYHLVRSEHRIALPIAERLEQIGEAERNPATLGAGHCRHGLTLFWLGEFDAALSLFKRCDSLRETAVRQALANVTAEDNYSMMMSYTGVSLAYLGYFDQARSRTAEGVLQARQVNHAYTLAHSLFFECWAAQLANLPDEVRPCIEEMFELVNEHGFPLFNAAAEFWRGWWLTVTGKVTEGAGLMANGYTMFRALPFVLFATTILGSIAETEAKLARPADGLSRLAEAARLIEVADERYHEAELHRLQGDLLYTTDDPAAAEQSFHRALAVARRQNAKTFELRAAMSLARLWRAQGKPQQARELLAPVYGWFTEGFDARDLKEPKALLQELAS